MAPDPALLARRAGDLLRGTRELRRATREHSSLSAHRAELLLRDLVAVQALIEQATRECGQSADLARVFTARRLISEAQLVAIDTLAFCTVH